jgi:RimJ/RimL family protein N-acetyltransferase
MTQHMVGMLNPVDVRIEPWSEDDLHLLEQLLGDPAMMEHLGGPERPEKIRERQARYVPEGSGMFRIVAGGEAVGSVGSWARDWRGAEVGEIGWSVLPAYQGRGIARAAAAQTIALARAEGARRFLHAFPSVDNAPSNAICRALGFTLLAVSEVEYPPGHPLTVNDWRLDLRAAA